MSVHPNRQTINRFAKKYADQLTQLTGRRQERFRRAVVSAIVKTLVADATKTHVADVCRAFKRVLEDIIAKHSLPSPPPAPSNNPSPEEK